MLNYNFDYKIISVKSDDNGNLFVLNMDIGNNNIVLVNLYGTNIDSLTSMRVFLTFCVISMLRI